MLISAEILDHLRSDTLDLSRIAFGTMELDMKEIDLSDLIKETVAEVETLANKKEQQILINIQEKVAIVRGDAFKLKRVITNYLSNAVRYSDEGKDISISLESKEKEVLVKVRDNGRGLKKEDLEKVYEKFFRTGKRIEGSTGLGLAIVRGIVEAHGGKAWAESEGEDKGSTFLFTLPLSDP